MTCENMTCENMTSANLSKKVSIYRYQFTEEINNAIMDFAKIHMYDDRHDYKEAWKHWWESNQNILDKEIQRLESLGYDGDIQDKMYKAGRYYFRKKDANKVKAKKRQKYIVMDKEVIKSMDDHILKNMKLNYFTPADGYVDYCKNNISIINDEIVRLSRENTLDAKDFIRKFKKTYKNRYFILSRYKVYHSDDDMTEDRDENSYEHNDENSE